MYELSTLIDEKVVRILDLLVDNSFSYFHLQKISEEAKVPLASTFRIVRKLEKLQFVKCTQIGKFKIYKILDKEKAKSSAIIKLVDPKLRSILTLLMQNKDALFHLQKISDEADVPLATTFRNVKKRLMLKIIKTVQIGKFTI